VADEHLAGAERMSVGAVGWWLDYPSVGAGSDEVALHLHQPTISVVIRRRSTGIDFATGNLHHPEGVAEFPERPAVLADGGYGHTFRERASLLEGERSCAQLS
jgi:hypothetical protein